jgi:hypothetical protein
MKDGCRILPGGKAISGLTNFFVRLWECGFGQLIENFVILKIVCTMRRNK